VRAYNQQANEGSVMKAMVCREFGEPEVLRLEEAQPRKPGPREVRVAIKAAGVNFPDSLMLAGKYQVKPPFPFTPGLEAAGDVIEVGAEVEGLAAGQRVMLMARRGGCFATELTLDAATVVPLPEGIDYVTAACFPITYGTAHFALTHRGQLKPGQTLLVTGAAGGVGIAAIEIGKALGARVIAAAGSPERLKIAAKHGADILIDYNAESLRDRVKAVTDGRGVDVAFDPVGGDIFDQCVRSMGWEGRLLVIGFAAGRIPSAPANLVLVKNFSVVGVVFGAHTERFPAESAARFTELLGWLQDGRLHPLVSQTYPLEEASRAVRQLAERRATGKLALVTS